MRHQAEIQAVLEQGTDLTIATLLPDGAPHATTVSYASEGLAIFFGCGAGSQKAHNLANDDRVAATINLPYSDWSEIRGLAIRGHACRLAPGERADEIGLLFVRKFPEVAQFVAPEMEPLVLYEIVPESISWLDYRRGFGHVEYVTTGEH